MAEKTAPVAPEAPAAKPERRNLATTVPVDVFDRFEEVAWQNKFRRNADALRVAVEDFNEKYGSVDGDANAGSNR